MNKLINIISLSTFVFLLTATSYAGYDKEVSYCSYPEQFDRTVGGNGRPLTEIYKLIPPRGSFCESLGRLGRGQTAMDCKKHVETKGYECFQIVNNTYYPGHTIRKIPICWGCL